MKSKRKLTTLLASLFLFAGLLIGSCLTVSAATAPKKVHIYPKSASEAIRVTLDDPSDEIENIKTSDKSLRWKLTGINIRVSSSETSEDESTRTIALYGTKEGKYTVSFDIVGADGTKKTSKKVTVFVNTDHAVKSATFAGKPTTSYPDKNSGKFVVTLNAGYTLKKIEVGKYVRTVSDEGKSIDTDMTYKKIKNGANITLSKVPYEYGYESGSLTPTEGSSYRYYSKYWNTDATAETIVRVTYIDKYTKEEATTHFYLYRLAI